MRDHGRMMEGAYEASVDRRYLFSDRKHLDIGGHSESGKPCRIQLTFLFGAVFYRAGGDGHGAHVSVFRSAADSGARDPGHRIFQKRRLNQTSLWRDKNRPGHLTGAVWLPYSAS